MGEKSLNIKRFFAPIRFRKRAYFKQVLLSLFVGVNSISHILFLERIVNSLEESNREAFLHIILFYAGYILVFEVIHIAIRNWGWVNTIPFTMSDIYREYLGAYIKMDNNSTELIGTGKLVGIMQEGSKVWAVQISRMIENGGMLLVTMTFTIFMLWRVDILYCILFIVLGIIFGGIVFLVDRKQEKYRDRRYEYRNTRLRILVKVIMGKMEILQSGNIHRETTNLHHISKAISGVNIEMSIYRTIVKRTAPFGITILLCIIFLVLGNQVLNNEISLSVLVGLSGALIIMQRSISDAVNFYTEFSKEFISINKLWMFCDSTPQIEGYEEGNTFKHKSGKIELKNLSYGYTPETPIFKDFSLKIPGNRVTALVGPSGGGKSTLVKLISGYIRQDAGDILVDDQNLRETNLKSYYQDIGYLTQEPSVFDGTVRENLEYGVQNVGVDPCVDPNNGSIDSEIHKTLGQTHGSAPTRELEKIISLAHCEFIYDLPNGLDTEIGERGVKLSGGQKQRLAIAKIFLKDPKIIILDEPTSALDSLSEKKITEAMHNLFTGRTVIVIAHRLQTVKHADDIIVIEGGKVIERGTHSELTKKKGFYKEMLDLQSGF